MNTGVKIYGQGLGVKLRASTILTTLLATGFVTAAVVPAYAAIDNTATVTGFSPGQDPLVDTPAVEETATESVDVETLDPEFVLEKIAGLPSVTAGADNTVTDELDTITYTYTIENTGNATLQPGATPITDPGPTFDGSAATNSLSAITLSAASDVGSDGVLSPGETWTYTATYTLAQADIDNAAGTANSVENTVTAASFETTETDPLDRTAAVWDPDGSDPNTDDSDPTATTTITGTPSLTLSKIAGTGTDLGGAGTFVANDGTTPGPEYAVGDVITYQFTVENDGTVTMSNITITDTAFSGANPAGLSSITCDTQTNGSITLAPGATEFCEATYTVVEGDLE